ncbi:MAG: hypothetical protein ABIJ12_07070 [bacterium]
MQKNKAAILLSRQSMRPSGNTPWIKNTYKALKWIKANNYTLISSVGMQTWEMITAIASDLNITQEIQIPCKDNLDFNNYTKYAIEQFEIDKNITKLLPILPEQNKSHLHLRDEIVLGNADFLVPVSIRSDGFMKSYIQTNKNNQNIIEKFQTDYQSRIETMKYSIGKDNINPSFKSIGNTCLTHWTRSTNYNWPDETKISYWRSIVSSNNYPRRAFQALKHILSVRNIISSERHMPKGVNAVSFTSLPPIEAISLMKWRARYREMSFEPYGIAIEKDWGIKNGITEVQYFDPSLKQKPTPEEKWHSQSIGKKTDWQQEHEYRYKNDFNLDIVPKNKLIAICYKPDEIKEIESDFGIRAISILSY